MIATYLRELNRINPFLWEVHTDGYSYEIWCEGSPTADPETGEWYGPLKRHDCEAILKQIIDEVR